MAVLGASVSAQTIRHDTRELTGYVEALRRHHLDELGLAEIVQFSYSGNRISDGGIILLDRVIRSGCEICLVEPLVEDDTRGSDPTEEEASHVYRSLIDAGILPITLFLPRPRNGTARVWPTYGLLEGVCARFGVPLIELALDDPQVQADFSVYFSDAIHTRARGAELYASRIAEKLLALGDLDELRRNLRLPAGLGTSTRLASLDPPDFGKVRRLGVRVTNRSDETRAYRVIQLQKVGPHSPLVEIRARSHSLDPAAPAGISRDDTAARFSVWDLHCHYVRSSFVTLVKREIAARSIVDLDLAVSAEDPDYAACRREGFEFPPAGDRYLLPLGEIHLISDGELGFELNAYVPLLDQPAGANPDPAPAPHPEPSTSMSQPSLIDTSKMSAGQRAALEMAEASRDERALSGFAASLFDGRPDFSLLFPFPEQSAADRAAGDEFIGKLDAFLQNHTDPDAIDRDGEIPDAVFGGLARLGCFGIKIPREYGGLGLSQTNYSRAAMRLGAHDGNLTALLSAHQSIGIPQPLLVFGTEEQKAKYLPRCAAGQVSAFALTEKEVGSDPAQMSTEATLSEDGRTWTLTGEKLWCTNLLKAKALIVMAKTPLPDKPQAVTAFIVEVDWPGVEIVTRCRFMGLRALYNGVVRFHEVRVPAENVVGGVGRGLKVALTTLNTGRLTLPAACVGLLERCRDIALGWSGRRVQWGQAIGKHAAIAGKIADLSADAFATDALVRYTSALVDRDHDADIRLEAALAKLWGTEAGWRGADSTMQIKGGRGYETADSLRARGETPDPVERMLRDARINTIFEGSTEIMHLFIAREALDPHLRRGAAALDSRKPKGERAKTAAAAGLFYAGWYPLRCLPGARGIPDELDPSLKKALRRVAGLSRRLARTLFHSMARYGPKLDRQQLLLARLVNTGAELLAIAVSASRAHSLGDARSLEHARYIAERGVTRIRRLFAEVADPADRSGYRLAQNLLQGRAE